MKAPSELVAVVTAVAAKRKVAVNTLLLQLVCSGLTREMPNDCAVSDAVDATTNYLKDARAYKASCSVF